MIKLNVLYPQPANVDQFEKDYADHIQLLHEKLGIPTDQRPYSVTKYMPSPNGPSPFYQMFAMPFESEAAFQAAMASQEMQDIAADAHRISSGGAPVIMIGNQA